VSVIKKRGKGKKIIKQTHTHIQPHTDTLTHMRKLNEKCMPPLVVFCLEYYDCNNDNNNEVKIAPNFQVHYPEKYVKKKKKKKRENIIK
jgi:hypothetical protein